MQRLIHDNINTPEEYARIFDERAKKEPDWADVRRWDKLLSKYNGGTLIDLGCLDSPIPVIAKERFPDSVIVGFDFSMDVIKKRSMEHVGINWYCGDVTDTKLDQRFDYAVLGEVIEHLEYPYEATHEAARILRPGGILALSTPLNEAIEPGAVDGHRHLWSFDEADIRNMLEPFGTVEIEILRSQQEPEYRYSFPVMVAFLTKK